jgi:hypothetical protein
MASNFYRQGDAPRYIMGHALELAFIGAGIIAALILVLNYNRINKARRKDLAAGAISQFTTEELSALGDKAMTWAYMY